MTENALSPNMNLQLSQIWLLMFKICLRLVINISSIHKKSYLGEFSSVFFFFLESLVAQTKTLNTWKRKSSNFLALYMERGIMIY